MSCHRLGCSCERCALPLTSLWGASTTSEQATGERATGGHVEGLAVLLDDHAGACPCEECVALRVLGGGS